MDLCNLYRAIRSAISEAEHACDPFQNTLMDRGDLQRTILRLKHTLEQVERVCDDLQAQKDEFGVRLSRSHAHWDGAQSNGQSHVSQ